MHHCVAQGCARDLNASSLSCERGAAGDVRGATGRRRVNMVPDRGSAATMRTKMAVCLFFALLPAAVGAENLVVPRDNYAVIKSKGYDQDSDIFDKKNSQNPPHNTMHLTPTTTRTQARMRSHRT